MLRGWHRWRQRWSTLPTAKQHALGTLDAILSPRHLIAIGLLDHRDADVVKHKQIILPGSYQFLGQCSRIRAAALTDVTCCLARLGGERHQHAAMLAGRQKTLAAARALQSVAAGVEHEIMGRVRGFAS